MVNLKLNIFFQKNYEKAKKLGYCYNCWPFLPRYLRGRWQKYLFDFVIFCGWVGGNGCTSLIVKFGLGWGWMYTQFWFWHWKTFDPGITPSHILNNPTIVFGLITNVFTNPLHGIQYFIPLETNTITKHKSVLTLL